VKTYLPDCQGAVNSRLGEKKLRLSRFLPRVQASGVSAHRGQGTRVARGVMGLAHLAPVSDQVHVESVAVAGSDQRLQKRLGLLGGRLTVE